MTLPCGSFTVAADHPSLPGHFPGRPVVPGVVVLDHLFGVIEAAHPAQRVTGLRAVKFIRPVLPGQRVEVGCGSASGTALAFSCTVDRQEVARGSLLLGPAA